MCCSIKTILHRMESSHSKQPPNFKVVPLDTVRHEAKKILTPQQLKAAIDHVKLLKFYPDDVGLDFGPCGEGFELRVDEPIISKQSWLRVGFWVCNKTKSIYIVDVFWKKENRISTADRLRIEHRIRKLQQQLGRK